jgi:8-hydroxy-5-deazaflavin:NADPH oxidoreductase
MKIGIIGAGNIGSALAGHFHKPHHSVLIANSRGPETLFQVAQKTGAIPAAISEGAKGVDLLVITIHMKSVPLLPKEVLAELPADITAHRHRELLPSSRRCDLLNQRRFDRE